MYNTTDRDIWRVSGDGKLYSLIPQDKWITARATYSDIYGEIHG